jgi:hypothetical protein
MIRYKLRILILPILTTFLISQAAYAQWEAKTVNLRIDGMV